MKKLCMLLTAVMCWGCSVPPENENRHYSIWIANNSDRAIFVDFCRSYFSNPSEGAVNYAKFKKSNYNSSDYLILPGEKNYSACDIGSDDGFNTIEWDMDNCDWIIFIVDPVIIALYPFEELNWTEIGVIAQRKFTFQDVKDRGFQLTYPDDFE